MELIASTIAGIIVAGVTSGFSWAGAFYGVVTFLGVLLLAFVIHLLLSPSALDKGRQEEKQRLLERINGQEQEIAELRKNNLTFEVLTEIWNSKVSLDDPGDTEDYRDAYAFFLTAELFLRFFNDDLHPIRLTKDIWLAIITPSGPVPLKHLNKPTMQKSGVGDTTYFTGFVIPGKEQTEPIFFRFFVDVPRQTALSVDKNSFLRVTMKAGTQDPYSVDVDVPWRAARKRSTDVSIRPPKTAD